MTDRRNSSERRRSSNRSSRRRSEGCTSTQSSSNFTCLAPTQGLDCAICKCICYQPVTIAPCFHSFCGGCLSKWCDEQSGGTKKCPTCRETVLTVSRNHHMEKLAKVMNREYPNEDRTPAELQDLESSNIFISNVTDMRHNSSANESPPSASSDTTEWERRGVMRVSVSPTHMYISQFRTVRRPREHRYDDYVENDDWTRNSGDVYTGRHERRSHRGDARVGSHWIAINQDSEALMDYLDPPVEYDERDVVVMPREPDDSYYRPPNVSTTSRVHSDRHHHHHPQHHHHRCRYCNYCTYDTSRHRSHHRSQHHRSHRESRERRS